MSGSVQALPAPVQVVRVDHAPVPVRAPVVLVLVASAQVAPQVLVLQAQALVRTGPQLVAAAVVAQAEVPLVLSVAAAVVRNLASRSAPSAQSLN